MRSLKTSPPVPPLAVLLAAAAGWCSPGCSLDFDTAFSESGVAAGGGSGGMAGQAGSTGGSAGLEAGAGGSAGEGPDAFVGAGGSAGEGLDGSAGAGGAAAGGAGGFSGEGPDASAGAGGSSGGAGSGGMAGDASTGDADAGLVCDPVPGGDGGMVSRWRDWAQGVCEECPAAPLNCDEFDPVNSVLDTSSRMLRIELLPGKAEIVSASIWFDYEANGPDGEVYDFPLSVSQNVLQADLSGAISMGVSAVWVSGLKLLDACGNVTMVTDFGIGVPYGASDDILIHCEQ